MPLVTITHRTTYRYAAPVAIGEHRLMLRPKGSAEARILDASLSVSPRARLSWGYDGFGNVVETAHFDEDADELEVVSAFTVLHNPRSAGELRRASLRGGEPLPDLNRWQARRSPDHEGGVAEWAARAASDFAGLCPFDAMVAMSRRIHGGLAYARRDEEGTQAPAETLRLGTGSCRDFAFLMAEAARCLGLPARFVSGYLYEDRGSGEVLVGGGATHAWAQVAFPGAGWVDFDPTNDIVGARNLLASAVTADPSQAVPISGSYFGRRSDYLGMEVDVETRSRPSRGKTPLWHAEQPVASLAVA